MYCVNSSDKPFIKFLGVTLDPKLNFKQHISHVSTKLSKSLYFLRSAKNFLNQRALTFIYYATFHSHLIYGIHVWSSTLESYLKPLLLKQKAAIRIISSSKYNAHTEPLFKLQKILPFPNLVEFFKLQFMQRFTQGYLPISFTDTWISNRIRREGQAQVELRDDDLLYIPQARTKSAEYQPLIAFPKIWAQFPDEPIKFIRNKLEFNNKLKDFFLNNLKDQITCTRLFCPACHS
jgi:hypothetical protein